MWEKFLAALTAVGIPVPKEKEQDLKQQVEKLTQDPNGGTENLLKVLEGLKGKQAAGPDDNTKILEAVMNELKLVKEQNNNLATLLADEKKNREEAIKVRNDADAAAKTKKVTDAIKKALDNKKIVEADKPVWQARLEKDFDEWNKELEAKPVAKQLESKKTGEQQQQQQTPTSRGSNSILNSINEHNQNAALPELK